MIRLGLISKQHPYKSGIRMSSILVYSGKGSNEKSRNALLHGLTDAVDPSVHDVKFISAEETKEGSWMSNSKAICFGGGFDLGFIESLGQCGMRNIREFVNRGGSYLGLCAGAYFACDFIEFDKNGPLEVCGERSLKFYQGKGIGPAFPGFDYHSRQGVHAVPVLYQNGLVVDAYMEGGGYFVPYVESSQMNTTASASNTEVLGKYKSLENVPDAVVKCTFGQGAAVLSGVHFEFSACHLNNEDRYLSKLLPNFLLAEGKRKYVFKDLLCQLGINCWDRAHSHIDSAL